MTTISRRRIATVAVLIAAGSSAATAAALIDRLVHHAHIITLKGKSYRLRDRATTPRAAAADPTPAGALLAS